MLKSKLVIITGAGSGLGRALAAEFSKAGSITIGLGRSIESLEETQRLIAQNNPQADFSYYQTDVSKFDQLQKTVGTILEKHGHIDYLFNNAAVYPKVNFIEESAEDFAQALAINVTGVSNGCKAVLPAMLKQKSGRIYNLGSFACIGITENSALYSASKAAVRALTQAIALDIAHHNTDVQIHEWVPGEVNTQMSDYSGVDPTLSASWAVALSQLDNGKKNCIFNCDHEWLPPKSLKERVISKLLFWK